MAGVQIFFFSAFVGTLAGDSVAEIMALVQLRKGGKAATALATLQSAFQ